MAELRKVCMQGDIPEGEGMTVEIDGKMIAVFKCGEKEFRAIDDHCPHMGASLSGGYVEDGMVSCPWHAWRFKLNDGTWADNPKIKIGSYPCQVGDDGSVFVKVEDQPQKK